MAIFIIEFDYKLVLDFFLIISFQKSIIFAHFLLFSLLAVQTFIPRSTLRQFQWYRELLLENN